MVCKMKCECAIRYSTEINSIKQFDEIKDFFVSQVNQNIYIEDKVEEPYYVWINGKRIEKTFATKWYRCNVCGCLWEFDYPDFPKQGFVKKYENGIYNGTTVIKL